MAKIAVAWLNENDWPTWQRLDNELPPYEGWLSKINAGIKDAERSGAKAEKTEIAPQILLTWCKAKGAKVCTQSRAAYAAELLMKRLSSH
jgi:hypothetical protein